MRTYPDWIKPGARAFHGPYNEPCTVLETMPDSSGQSDVMVRFDVPHERLGADWACAQSMLKPFVVFAECRPSPQSRAGKFAIQLVHVEANGLRHILTPWVYRDNLTQARELANRDGAVFKEIE